MSTLKQLWKERESAGAEYAAALETLRAAFVRLGAVERTLRNGNVGGGEFQSFHFSRHRLEDALRSLQHTQFVPRILITEWRGPIVVVSDEQINGFKPD
jgi:hypothetical protein